MLRMEASERLTTRADKAADNCVAFQRNAVSRPGCSGADSEISLLRHFPDCRKDEGFRIAQEHTHLDLHGVHAVSRTAPDREPQPKDRNDCESPFLYK
jgi:hypothetical protein